MLSSFTHRKVHFMLHTKTNMGLTTLLKCFDFRKNVHFKADLGRNSFVIRVLPVL